MKVRNLLGMSGVVQIGVAFLPVFSAWWTSPVCSANYILPLIVTPYHFTYVLGNGEGAWNMLTQPPPPRREPVVTGVFINGSLSLCRHAKMSCSLEKYFGKWKSLYKCWQNFSLLINVTPIFYLKF